MVQHSFTWQKSCLIVQILVLHCTKSSPLHLTKSLVFMAILHSLSKFSHKRNKDESLHWMKHFNLSLAVVNVFPVLVSSWLLLSTHLPTSEGWTAEVTVGLGLIVPMTGFEPTQVINYTRPFDTCMHKPFQM